MDMYGFVSTDENGQDALLQAKTQGGYTPMVAVTRAQAESLEPYAQKLARKTHSEVRLVKFSTAIVVKTYGGGGIIL